MKNMKILMILNEHSIILLLAEIEKQATENDLYVEKEILEPDDEGYVEPKI